VVTSLRDNTFFAVIEMRMSDGNRMVLDSRPSDAIALALRADCPIYVDADVIKASRNTVPSEDESGEESTLSEEEWPDVIGEAGDLPM
jgi:bifunctional DNase/RNase